METEHACKKNEHYLRRLLKRQPSYYLLHCRLRKRINSAPPRNPTPRNRWPRRVKFNQACNLLNELLRLQAPLETPPFNALLTVGDIERGKELLDKMIEEGCSLMLYLLIHWWMLCALRNRIDTAIEFFNDMQGEGLKGNVVTCTTIIPAFCDVGNFNKPIDLFDRRLRSECSVDVTIYHKLIYGLCKAGRMDDAHSVLLKFKQGGVCPDIVCYNALINGDSNRMAFCGW
ncbi:hypothetical protein F3Y22_tig00110793pilonHSYRG00111 [Hibiscus syriacus]|uniref:Pentatricopeptide repeat-containing protein n=1 Tax=Hibiscus syriacus TaxID=106335 RepID=A0A6A2ZRB7_HIBSY|nr:pentatricopeptide repeat-containing protein At3g61520, mitochondrial-like [Hibiscus syriacus]KAE8693849.1 hypothetical protein F3Y22_tig00110793pilonHSYRG00111 [Hibiscus syriacus]